MIIYYVVPPHGVKFRSMADAQSAFESGQRWECVGEALVSSNGVILDIAKYPETSIPMRYSECHQVVQHLGDGATVTTAVPKAFAMQWKPGRCALLRYSIGSGERMVGQTHGNVAMGGRGAVQPKKLNPMKPANRSAEFIGEGHSVLVGEEHGKTSSGLGFSLPRTIPMPDGPVWERPHDLGPEWMVEPSFLDWASQKRPYRPSDWALDRYYAGRKAAAGFSSDIIHSAMDHNGKKVTSDNLEDPFVNFKIEC